MSYSLFKHVYMNVFIIILTPAQSGSYKHTQESERVLGYTCKNKWVQSLIFLFYRIVLKTKTLFLECSVAYVIFR